jgi:hypothetical protein
MTAPTVANPAVQPPVQPTIAVPGGPGTTPSATVGRLGWEPGQPVLYEEWGARATAPKRDFASDSSPLPSPGDESLKKRPLWRHPAFIVSMITTVLAIGTGVTMLLMGAFSDGPPTVSSAKASLGSGNLHLTWNGPDVPYDLFIVDPGSKPTDISQLVHGDEAWIPNSFGYYTDSSCFVIRAQSQSGAISTDPGDLEEQGAKSVCVTDATE